MKKFHFATIVTCTLVFLITIPSAFAVPTITWDCGNGCGHSVFDGAVGDIFAPTSTTFTVNDPDLAIDPAVNTINVLVNSTSDPAGITLTLTETGPNTGIFTNTNLIFTNGTGTFAVPSSQTIGINKPSLNTSPTTVEKIISSLISTDGIQVFSTTDHTNGIFLNLTETGPNTGKFTNTLKFTSGPSIDGSSISVSGGNVVTIVNLNNFDVTNELVLPNPDPAFGALPAKFGDEVDAVYKGVKENIVLSNGNAPGGGGGGLIRPSLVLDILAAIGGSSYIVAPPSFGGSYYHFSDGLTLNQGDSGNKETFDISNFNTEVPKQVMTPGETAHMTFKTFEGYNSNAVVGMTLYFIPRGQDLNMDVSKSIADIEWKKGKPVEVDDPNHILSNIQASSDTDGKFQYTKFVFVPTKSYDKMSFIVRAWNDHLYTTEARVHDGIDTPTPVKTLPTGVIQYNSFDDLYSALDKDGYPKPTVLSHIHDTNSVFGSSDAGKIFWLYDTTNKTVTLVISDKDGNELGKTVSSLEPLTVEKKGDYGFMHFTTKQLNGWNEDDMKRMMGIESSKAMFSALEKGTIPHRNW